MTMKVLLPEPQSFHETEERGCHFEQVTCSSITLWTVRLLDQHVKVDSANMPKRTQAWHNIPWSYMTFRHDFTTFFHSLLSSLSSDLVVKGFYSTCHDVAWSGFRFPRSYRHSTLTAPIQSSCQEASELCCHFFEVNIQTSLNLQEIPRSRRLNFRSNWLAKNFEIWRQSNEWRDDVTWNFTSAKEVAKPMLDRSILRQFALGGISSGIGSDTVKMLFFGRQPKCDEDL